MRNLRTMKRNTNTQKSLKENDKLSSNLYYTFIITPKFNKCLERKFDFSYMFCPSYSKTIAFRFAIFIKYVVSFESEDLYLWHVLQKMYHGNIFKA